MKDSEVVQAAAQLLADPKNWVKGEWCLRLPTNGDVISRFCLDGALGEVLGIYTELGDELSVWQLNDDGSIARDANTLSPLPLQELLDAKGQMTRIRRVMGELVMAKWPHIMADWAPAPDDVVDEMGPIYFNDHGVTEHVMVLELLDLTYDKLVEMGR